MTAGILSMGKSVPPYSLSQMEIADYISNLMNLQEEEAWFVEKIYKNSAISKRYSVLPYIMHPKSEPFSSKGQDCIGMSERNAIYKKEAPLLAEKAVREALKNWAGSTDEITHVLSVSCTGAVTPGIEFILAQRLGLDPHVSLLGINFMGCYGSFKALKIAAKIAKDNPKNRILLVSTELCTLHFKPKGDIESVVIQSLFADGSAAAIIGTPRADEIPLFVLGEEQSYIIGDSSDEMSWDASDEGFDMTLTSRVPKLISDNIALFIKKLIGDSPQHDYEWAIHPGGKAIIEAIENSLKLDRSLTASSWNVLNKFGNLSSASFLYVLDDISKRTLQKEKIVGIGLGPGLVVEGLLLQKPRTKHV